VPEPSHPLLPLSHPTPWGRWTLLLGYGVVLLVLSLAARDPDSAQWLDPQALSARGHALLATPLGPVAVVAAYVLLVLMAMPVLALIILGTTVFGPWPGMAYAWVGMLAGASVAFAFGRFSSALGMDRFMHGRLGLLRQHLHRRGLWTVALVRLMPLAPFMMVNLAAGALRVRWRDFVLGSAMGLLPVTVVVSLFTDRLLSAWRSPTPLLADVHWTVWLVGLAIGLGAVTLFWRWRRQRRMGPGA
jgi:uncharacterized membrane protein YdjX (TVP38/TMEM64 family)